MSKTGRENHRRTDTRRRRSPRPDRHVTVRSVPKTPPDLRKLSRAVIALAMAEAEAENDARADGAASAAADADGNREANND